MAEIDYDWKQADTVAGEDILSYDANGKFGQFLQACLGKWAELHPENPTPVDENIVYELLMEIGRDEFVALDNYSKAGANRAYMLYLAYQFSHPSERLPDTETIRGIWYLRKGFKLFAIKLLGNEFDGRRASQDLSAVLVELVDTRDFEYFASFCIMDEGAWSQLSSERGFSNVIVCVEKDARATKLVSVCRCLGLRVLLSGGGRPKKAKTEELWYKHLRASVSEENPIWLVCATDYDYAGKGIVKNFHHHFSRYTENVKVVHAGVFPWHVEEDRRTPEDSFYDLNEGKTTRRRVNANGVVERQVTTKAGTVKKDWHVPKRPTGEDQWFGDNAIRYVDANGETVYCGVEIDVIEARRWNEIIAQAIFQNTPFSSQNLIDYSLRWEGRHNVDCDDMVDMAMEKTREGEFSYWEGEVGEYDDKQAEIERLQAQIRELEEEQEEIRDGIQASLGKLCEWVTEEVNQKDGRIAPDETPIWKAVKTRRDGFYMSFLNDNLQREAREEVKFYIRREFEGEMLDDTARPLYRPKFNSARFEQFREDLDEEIAGVIEDAKRGDMEDLSYHIRALKRWYNDQDGEVPHIDQVLAHFKSEWDMAFEEWKVAEATRIVGECHVNGLDRMESYQTVLDWFTEINRDPIDKAKIDEILDAEY